MAARGLLVMLLFLVVSPQTQPPMQSRFPIHVESLAYPPIGIQSRTESDVVLIAEVSPEGGVICCPTFMSGKLILAQAAIDNLRTWRFQTGTKSYVTVTYHFKLEGDPVSRSEPGICKFDLPDSVSIVAHPIKPDH